MKKQLFLASTLWTGFVALLILMGDRHREMDMPTTEQAIMAKLKEKQRHLDPRSAQAAAIAVQLRAYGETEQEPKEDQPDEFVRILREMRIPYGETEPSYPPNYRMKELQKAERHTEAPSALLLWVERGPGNVAGRARGLVVDPDDATGNTWFVGTVGGGIWKTTNAGTTWTDIVPNLPTLAVSTIVMAPSDHNVLYAGTGESMFSVDVINGDGIVKSTDRGQTWTQLPSTAGNPNFNNIARILVDPNDANIVIAATSSGRYKQNTVNRSGIFKSTNGGTSWTEVYNETTIGAFGRVNKVLQIIDTPGDFNTLYAGVDERGVLKSTNAGNSWFSSSVGIGDVTGRFELAVSPVNPSKIFAASEGSPNSNLYVSTNAGASWVQTVENGPEPNWLSAQGWYDNTIVAHPTNENVVYVGGVRLYQITFLSGNQRLTTQLSVGPVHVDHHNLVILPRAGGSFRILNANDGGIGLSADSSANWSKPTTRMNTAQFYGVDKKPGESAYIGGMQDNGTWRSPVDADASSSWTFQIGGDGYETSWHFDNPLKIIGGSQYNGLRRSLDGGVTWISATNGLSDVGSGSAPFITKIGKTNMAPELLFAVGSSGVWRSTNFGANWSLTPVTGTDWGSISTFTDVKVSRADPNIVWAGMRMDASGKINVSTNGGLSFTPTTVFPGVGGISGMSTHPRNDSTAYVLFSFAQKPKILRTTNLGQAWEDISGFGTDTVSANGFPDVAIYDLLVMPHTPDTIWAGTEIGLFESTNNGVSWHKANNGLPNISIWAMTHVDDEVVLATHGRGIWSVHIPGLSGGGAAGPLLSSLFQGPDGFLTIRISQRALYDSTVVFINGARFVNIGPNAIAPRDTSVLYPVTQAATLTVGVTSYINGTSLAAPPQNVNVVPIAAPQGSYVNNFNTTSSDFTGASFQITMPAGFTNNALHSAHPYADGTTIFSMLTIPIVVASSNAFLAYDDVALVEPGEPGSVFGDNNFYDYVVVEGTSDGITWTPLADGYDARYDAAWLSAYNSSTPGSATLFRHHEVNLLNTFTAGEQILVRFRLFADPFVNGWGWVVDNVEIQQRLTGVETAGVDIPKEFRLEQNYPNPFNPSTTIRYALPQHSTVSIGVFSITGQKVVTLAETAQAAGFHEVQWSGTSGAGFPVASGMYLYRIDALGADGKRFVQTRKMIFMK